MTKTALITGASRGLGAAMAEALAPEHHIIALGRTTGALEELDDRIRAKGGEATLAPMDITTDAAMQQLCRSIFDRWGGLSVWIHAAIHAAPLSPAPDATEKDMAASLSTNVSATARLIRYVGPLLGTSGTAAFFNDPRAGAPLWASYGTSKAGQIALARSWQAETTKTGPKVHILTPPPMPTATRARFFPGEDRESLTSPQDAARDMLQELGLS